MDIARQIVSILEEKKGEDIVLIDIHEMTTLADYFVICSGGSDRTVRALVDAVQETLREKQNLRGRVEGQPEDGWMLVDYDVVVLHVFSPDQRAYYRLEELWREGRVLVRLQ